MTDGDIDPHADALGRPVFGVSPKEDQGVVAQEGFGFQYDCIAKLAIRMLDDESIVSIVCETHEDCVVVFVEQGTELVSCKARSPSKPYTVPALLGDGGLLHLFDRWEHTGRTSGCRLMTDGALADGDAKKLVACCHSRSPQQIAWWGTKLASAFDATPALVTEFLGGLSVQCDDLRPREKLGLITSYNMLQRHLRAAKLNSALHQEYYTRIREEVRRRCSTAQADPWDGASLLNASLHPHEAANKARLRRRLLDRACVEACLYGDPPPAAPLDGSPFALDHTRMTLKLERGEVGPATVAAARRVRASWYEFEAARRDRAPGSASGFEDLRARVLLVAAEAESEIDRSEPYGARLFQALRGRLDPAAVDGASVAGLTAERLLGLAFQLTDECELFWSAPFDVDAELT